MNEKYAGLNRQLFQLQMLVFSQRSLRLILRAAWLGMGGYLLAWGCYALWGWLPDPKTWMLIGLLLASPALLPIFFRWPRRNKFVWQLDRNLSLKEQVSTAWSVVCQQDDNLISKELVGEVSVMLAAVRKRIFRKGWFFSRDLVSTLIVAILAFSVYTAAQSNQLPLGESIPAPSRALPALGKDPSSGDIFPGGNLALPPKAETPPEGPGDAALETPQLSQNDISQLDDTLKALGENLDQMAATYEASKDLQSDDLQKASDAFQTIADKLDALPPEQKSDLAQQLQDAAEQLENTSMEALQKSLAEAANGVQAVNDADPGQSATSSLLAKEQLDQIAADLRQISSQMAENRPSQPGESGSQNAGASGSGGGAGLAPGSGEKGAPESFARLGGQGDEIELDVMSEADAALLMPGSTNDPGINTASGSAGASSPGSDETVNNYITPFTYPWRWRDVVAAFFKR